MTATTPESVARPGLVQRVFSPHGELASAVVAGLLLFFGVILTKAIGGDGPSAVGTGFFWVSLLIGMVFGSRAALDAVREGKVDIDVLMVVGAALAAALGAPAEGALLLFLFVLSGALEDLAMARTTRAIEALHKLMPTIALRKRGGSWEEVAPETLVPGDRLRILPGEIVPTDSTIPPGGGCSEINQASITGESMPRRVSEGDDLFAGTINVGNPLEAVVTRAAAQSSLQKILDLVTAAQQQREPVQRVIDKLSQPYAIGVFIASFLAMLYFRFAFHMPWLGSAGSGGSDGAVYGAITLLIVASPCALIIATPTATLAAISRAARGGVLFKGGQSIERLSLMGAIAFDKTGTLTIGRPRVMKIQPLDGSDEGRLLAIAAGLEEHSTHPIATAIVEQARVRSVQPIAALNAGYTAGRGLTGEVEGRAARLGSLHHVREALTPAQLAQAEKVLAGVQHRGNIGVVCAVETEHGPEGAVFILSDAARPGAECLVERLHAMGVRPVVMLTGDNTATAERVAKDLGLDRFHAQLLPGQKVEHVQALKAEVAGTAVTATKTLDRGKHLRGVGVIGDGVNDAPALAAADVAIGIGSIGSDAALESADIVLLSDDLSAVPWAVGLARRARRTIKINLVFALSAIGLMALTVLLGPWISYRLPLWLGVIGHEGGTLLVVAHSLLLLTHRSVDLCPCDRSCEKRATEARTELTVSAAGVGA